MAVDLHTPRLVDRSVGEPESKLADEIGVVEVCAATPREGVPGHRRAHAGAIVDHGHGRHRVGPLPLLSGSLERDVDAPRPGLQSIVHQFPHCCCGAAVAVLALRFHRRLGVEERELEVFGEALQVLVLTGQFSKQSICSHVAILQAWLLMAAHWV
jgi:hypothetical protein